MTSCGPYLFGDVTSCIDTSEPEQVLAVERDAEAHRRSKMAARMHRGCVVEGYTVRTVLNQSDPSAAPHVT